MSPSVVIAAMVVIVMFGGAGAYVIVTSVHMTATATTTSTVTTTASTSVVTVTSTTLCATTVTGTLGNFRGMFPNGTLWISIDGHYHTGNSIINGTTPTQIPPNGSVNNWWVISSC